MGIQRLDDPNSLNIYVSESGDKGRGVFAMRKILRDELIERSAVIAIPSADWKIMEDTMLSNYVFDWGENDEDAAVALGCISIYNHSYTPNAELTEYVDDGFIEVAALRDIEAGEEIFVNYNGEPDDQEGLWFDVIDNVERNPV